MSSGFISEAEIEERRRVRQEEWEKVRKPDEPAEAPEEEHDNRTLFERLEEQRKKKEHEYEETHKLKNMIKGLDDDDIEFLDLVDRTKMAEEKRLKNEEAKELEQFRSKVAALKEKSLDKEIEEEVNPVFSSLSETFLAPGTQMPHNKALANLVKKRTASEKLPASPPAKKHTEDSKEGLNGDSKLKSGNDVNSANDVPSSKPNVPNEVYPSAMKVVGILPGIGSYISDDSSDSENTSGSELDDQAAYNLLGQKVEKKVRME